MGYQDFDSPIYSILSKDVQAGRRFKHCVAVHYSPLSYLYRITRLIVEDLPDPSETKLLAKNLYWLD